MARPVRTHTASVRPEWGDYNDHLTEGYYGVVFGEASDGLLDRLGFGSAYRATQGGTFYTVEAHIRFEAEVAIGADVVVDTILLGCDQKRLHYWHELRVVGDDVRRATQEGLMLHVDIDPVRVSPMGESLAEAARRLAISHQQLARSVQAGAPVRGIR